MKHAQKNTPLMLLILIAATSTFAQDHATATVKRSASTANEAQIKREEVKEVAHKNEFTVSSDSQRVNPGNTSGASHLDLFRFDAKLKVNQEKEAQARLERAKEVRQDNEYIPTGKEKGIFLENPLVLNDEPLDYGDFDLLSTGTLTVRKGSEKKGQTTPVDFYIYLRRDGNKVLLPGNEKCARKYKEVEIGDILQYAEPGDLLVIEAVNAEDGAVKRILKIRGRGC